MCSLICPAKLLKDSGRKQWQTTLVSCQENCIDVFMRSPESKIFSLIFSPKVKKGTKYNRYDSLQLDNMGWFMKTVKEGTDRFKN